MARRKCLYIVCARTGMYAQPVKVYQTSKKEKAYNYLHKVIMKDSRYVSAYVDCIYAKQDKHDLWRDC